MSNSNKSLEKQFEEFIIDPINESNDDPFNFDFWIQDEPKKKEEDIKPIGCKHEFNWYEGIMEQYFFCIHCDKKIKGTLNEID